MGYECYRCDRDFVHLHALRQHQQYSSAHNICPYCDRDVFELDPHVQQAHPWICQSCTMSFKNRKARDGHFHKAHWYCGLRETFYSSSNNLIEHQIVHKPADLKCWGCDRRFRSPAHIFLHMESGFCESGITEEEIWDIVVDVQERRRDFRGDPDRLTCNTCDRTFRYLSAFLQHLESPTCSTDNARYFFGLMPEVRKRLGLEGVQPFYHRVV